MKTPAKTNPRFSYRTPKKEKADIENRIKILLDKANIHHEEYYLLTQNSVFLEAVYRGLDYLEKSKLSPSSEYYQMEFKERKKAA